MLFNAAYLLVAAAAVQAIKVTSPTKSTEWAAGVPQTITWESVETDPTSFRLEIVEQDNGLQATTIAETVQTSAGSYSYTPSAAVVGQNVRINLVNSQTSAILAQSDEIVVKQGSASTASVATTATTLSAVTPLSSSTMTSVAGVSGAASGVAAASNATLPTPSAPASGAGALAPSLALVAGSLIAFLA